MTLTLLDLYNKAATQEWSMYDNDAATDGEFEQSLVLALNKAVQEILYSYQFNFRERTHVMFTVRGMDSYDIPTGIIKQDDFGNYCVKIGGKALKLISQSVERNDEMGIPDSFYIKGYKLVLFPTPVDQLIVTIDYTTLAIGENKDGEEIFALTNDDDVITVPPHLENLFQNAVISRAMLNSIASESDENYSAYKKQSETAYRLLIKYSKGVGLDKVVRI